MRRKTELNPDLMSRTRERTRTLAAACIIVVAGFIAYHNSFAGVFLFDEGKEIVNNEAIRRLSDPIRILLATQRPLVNLSLAVNYALGGLRPGGYHFVNLAIHIVSALTLLGLVRRVVHQLSARSRNGLALMAALVWVVHPLNTQAVTYVIQRAESMMAMYYLLTLYLLLRGAEAARSASSLHSSAPLHLKNRVPDTVFPSRAREEAVGTNPKFLMQWNSRWWYVVAVCACALGMASKPIMVTAPVVALLFDRAFLAGTFRDALRRRWKVYVGLAATWSVLVAFGVLRTTFGTATREGAAAGFAFGGITPLEYALTQLWALCTYLRLAIVPYPQCFDYGWPIIRDAVTLAACGSVILGLVGATAVGLWKNRWWGFLGAMFFLVLAPTSSIIPIRDTIFEHRMYLPLACVVVVFVVAIHAAFARATTGFERAALIRKRALVGLCVVIVVGYSALTIARNRLYHSEITMWEDVVRKRPDNARAYDALGAIHDFAGRKDKAIELYQKSLTLRPDYINSRFNLGAALIARGRVEEGIAEYRSVLEQDPAHPVVRFSLGEALLGGGDAQGMALIREGLQKNPNVPTGHFVLGNALMLARDFDGAVAAYRESAKLRPTYAEAYYGAGNALMQLNRLDEAVAAFRQSLRLEPNRPGTLNNLGNVLARLERWSEAEEALRGALQIDPNHVNARFALGGVLRRTGRSSEAAAEYERILQLYPGHAPARQALEALRAGSP